MIKLLFSVRTREVEVAGLYNSATIGDSIMRSVFLSGVTRRRSLSYVGTNRATIPTFVLVHPTRTWPFMSMGSSQSWRVVSSWFCG